jgi:hypothetical protein
VTSPRRSLVALILALSACSGAKRSDAPTAGDTTPAPTATDAPSTGGAAMPDPTTTTQPLAPQAALVAWLDRNGGTPDLGAAPVLKLPVTIAMDADRLGITGATLGELAVTLDDTALGIALKDRVRQKYPAGAPGLRVWIEGRWRGDGKIQVTRFAGVIAADDAGDHVSIVPQ